MPDQGRIIQPWEVGEDPEVSPTAQVVATAPEGNDRPTMLSERRQRWIFVGVLSAVLALALAGVFGVRTTTTSGSGGGYDLQVSYARVSRPGLATPFDIEVTRTDGARITEPVQLAVSSRYLAMFDENGLDPAPAAATSTDDSVIWEFDPPPDGDTLVVSFDARIEPGVQWGRDGFVRILEGDRPVAESRFRTWVAP